MPHPCHDALLALNGITRTFPGVTALADVSFEVARGEVHAVVGENGAGKSTLIKILGGLYRPDGGSVTLGGKRLQLRNAHQSQQEGISVIYQEFNLMPDLTVAENIFVGREPRRGPFLDWRTLRRQTRELLARLNVQIDSVAIVNDLRSPRSNWWRSPRR